MGGTTVHLRFFEFLLFRPAHFLLLLLSGHSSILSLAIYWLQRKRPWSALFYGPIVIAGTCPLPRPRRCGGRFVEVHNSSFPPSLLPLSGLIRLLCLHGHRHPPSLPPSLSPSLPSSLPVMLLGLPTLPFEIAAGFIFGLGVSLLILTVAKPLGAVGCLVLGRSGREGGKEGG